MNGPARIAEAPDMTPMTVASVTGVPALGPSPDKVKEHTWPPELHAQGAALLCDQAV